MREEAAITEWAELYEAATRIKDLKPWESFWDMDLIGVQNGAEEDTVFYSILGRGGDCYGVSVYEGFDGLNDYLKLTMSDSMNLPVGYAMLSQRNMTCYWGDRAELSEKQRKIIKELGYKYRGKNQWLYFISYEPGYYPYNLNRAEVLRMTEHLKDLELALKCYAKDAAKVDFEHGNMYCLVYEDNKKKWSAGECPMPFVSFQFGNLIIEDEELLAELRQASKNKMILEAEVDYLKVSINDKKYDRPANPALCLIGEAVSGMILKFEMVEPEEDPMVTLAEEIVGFILQCGAPKEIRVTNVIVEAALEHLCDTCGIKLRRVKRLKGIEEFQKEMERFY